MTCDIGGPRSRIDRMYTNQHISFQLDYSCYCNALEWNFEVSRHRAISFARRSPKPRCSEDRPLDASVFKLPSWPDFVSRDFRARCEQDYLPSTPNRHSVLLKDSIRECHSNIMDKKRGWVNNSNIFLPPKDKLGKILATVKALQSRNHTRIAQLRISDRDITDTVPAAYDNESIVVICGQLRELAVKTARQIINDECKLLYENPPTTPTTKKEPRRISSRKFANSVPGTPLAFMP